ncbi:hypothetical protein WJX77_004003 [Trebouxia sp. C0004]
MDMDVGRLVEMSARSFHEAVRLAARNGADKSVLELWGFIEARPWRDKDGQWQFQNMRKFLRGFQIVSNRESDDLDAEGNASQHVPIVRRLSWVVTILEAQLDRNTSMATEELLKRSDAQGSAGLMLAQYVANFSAYFATNAMRYKDLKLPGGVVQCDVQGSIQLYDTKAVISVGEVKRSGSGYGEGINQLKERIAVLEWAVKCLRPKVTNFVKAGHLYMPLGTIKKQQAPVDSQELTIQLHTFI